jgi:hypothetical protein
MLKYKIVNEVNCGIITIVAIGEIHKAPVSELK